MVEPDATATFEVPGPYDLLSSLRLHRFGPLDPTTRLSREELWRAARLPEGPATLHVRIDDGAVVARAWGSGAAAMIEATPGLLGLRDDPGAFAPTFEPLRALMKRQRGLRLPRVPDPLRVLVQTILEQRVRWKDAATSFRGLMRRFSEAAPGPDPELRVMPEPRRLARLPLHEYAAEGVEQKRARVITAVCTSHRRIHELLEMPIEDAERRLRAFPGVGPWTAGMTLGYALGHADAAPTGDLGLPHLVSYALAGEPRGSDERMLELLEPFRPHRFRVIRMLMESGVRAPSTRPGGKLGPSPGRGRRF